MSEEILKQILVTVGKLDSRMERMESRMERMESRMDGIESRMERMESRMDGIESKIESIETKIESIESKIESIESKIEGLESRMDGMESNVGNLKATVATKSDVDTIGQQLSRLEGKLDSYHSENIVTDEKLLEGVRTTNDKVDFYVKQSSGELNELQFSIDVLQRNQFRLDTDLEKIKRK